MHPRSALTDIAGLILVAWAVLLAYVSVPTLLSDDPSWDGGISVLGAVLAAGHAAAAFGVVRRAPWGRRLGLAMGGIGLFGSAVVLITLAPGLERVREVIGSSPGMVLVIPAGMVVAYALVVFALYRARDEFRQPQN